MAEPSTALAVQADRQIAQLTLARRALAEAKTVPDVKRLVDLAAVAEVYATRQRLSEEAITLAHALKIDALAKLGELLRDTPKASGGRPTKTGYKSEPVSTLLDRGIDKRTSMVAQQLASLDAPTRAKIAAREETVTKAIRSQRHADALRDVVNLEKPAGLFDVIVIDPPWRYDRQPTDVGLDGEVDYATMTLDELKAIRLPAASSCVLWLWTTNSFMREAYELLAAWDFTPKTILTWDKVHMGLGAWLRNVTEHCILAVRGRPVVTLTNQTTILRETRRAHSQKPEAFYGLVEALCPGRRYEHFARTPRAGWAAYGLEATRFPAVDPAAAARAVPRADRLVGVER